MEERKDITRLIIKTILSSIACFIVFQGTTINNLAAICALLLSFGLFYSLCYLYQISLYITHNYFVALFVFFLLFGGIVFLYDKVSPILNIINPQNYTGEICVTIVITLFFLMPFLLNLFYVIKKSVVVKK